MIFVELGDDLQQRLDRLEIALVEIEVDDAHRLGQPQHLQVNVVSAAVELALLDRLGGRAAHGLDAQSQLFRDRLVRIAGDDQIEDVAAQPRALLPLLLRRRTQPRPRRKVSPAAIHSQTPFPPAIGRVRRRITRFRFYRKRLLGREGERSCISVG